MRVSSLRLQESYLGWFPYSLTLRIMCSQSNEWHSIFDIRSYIPGHLYVPTAVGRSSCRLKVFVPKKILVSFVLSSFSRFFFRFEPEAKLSRIWLKTLALETNLNEQLNSCKKTRVCCIKQPINSRSLAAVQEPVLLV